MYKQLALSSVDDDVAKFLELSPGKVTLNIDACQNDLLDLLVHRQA